MKILNLGCGEVNLKNTHKIEIHNLDYVKRKVPNFTLHNLNFFPYPYKNNTFDKIIMHDVLEHLCLYDRKNEYWINILAELYRILNKNGVLEIRTPHFASNSYLMEHHQLFSCGDFYMKFNGKKDNWYKDMLKDNFKIESLKIVFPKYNRLFGFFINQNQKTQIIYEKYFSGIIKSTDIKVVLKK